MEKCRAASSMGGLQYDAECCMFLGGLTDIFVEVKSCAELTGIGSVTCK